MFLQQLEGPPGRGRGGESRQGWRSGKEFLQPHGLDLSFPQGDLLGSGSPYHPQWVQKVLEMHFPPQPVMQEGSRVMAMHTDYGAEMLHDGAGDWLPTTTSLGTSRLWASTTGSLIFSESFFPAETTAKELCWGPLGPFSPQSPWEEIKDAEHHHDTEQWFPFTSLD